MINSEEKHKAFRKLVDLPSQSPAPYLCPLFLCLALILVGTIFRKHRINLVAILLLATASLPIVSQSLIQALEQDYELLTVDEVGEADAIVVLSGMVRTLNERKTLSYEWTDAADRIFAGIELSKANKAPKIVLTGGKLLVSRETRRRILEKCSD